MSRITIDDCYFIGQRPASAPADIALEKFARLCDHADRRMGFKPRSPRSQDDPRTRPPDERPRPMSRMQVVRKLVDISQYGSLVIRAKDLSPSLHAAVCYHFGSLPEARRQLAIPDPQIAPVWTRDRALTALRQLDREGVRITSRNLFETGHQPLFHALRKHFSSFDEARRAAGVARPERRRTKHRSWSPEKILIEVIDRYERGLSLARARVPRPLVMAGMRYFGTWDQTLESVGLNSDEHRLARRRFSRETIVQTLKQIATTRSSITLGELREQHGPLLRRASKLFGSIEAACEQAGLPGWVIRKKRSLLPKREIIKRLRERHKRGEPVYLSAVHESDSHLALSIRRKFWSWEDALDAAGVPSDSPHHRWSEQRVLDALRQRHASGRSLLRADVHSEDSRLFAATLRYFDTYQDAVRAAGIDTEGLFHQRWTRDKVIERLREFGRGGKVVRGIDLPRSLFSAACRFFGDLDRAREAAGVLGPPRPKIWTPDMVIEAIRKQHREHGRVVSSLDLVLKRAAVKHFGSWTDACVAAGVR